MNGGGRVESGERGTMVLQTDYGQSTTDFLYGMSEK